MERLDYTNMAEKLLGKELYIKYLTEIAKEYKSDDIINFGRDVVEKCCAIILMIGMSNKIKMDNIKIYVSDKVLDISCKEFAKKYGEYAKEVEKNLI